MTMAMAVKRKVGSKLTVKRNSILAAGNYNFHITGADFTEAPDKKKKNHFYAAMTVNTETSTGLSYKETFYVGEKTADDENGGEYTVFANRYEEAATFVEKVLNLDTTLDELTPDIVDRLNGHDFNADIEHREGITGVYPRIVYHTVEAIEEAEEDEE